MINILKNNSYLVTLVRAFLISSIGIIFPFAYLLLPNIFITESIKSSIIKSMACFSGVCLIVYGLISPVIAIVILSIFGPMILTYHYLIMRKVDSSKIVIISAVVFIVAVYISFTSFGINSEYLGSKEIIDEMVGLNEVVFSNANMQIDKADFVVAYNRMLQIIPSTLIVIALFTSYINYVISFRALLKQGKMITPIGSFPFLKLPKGTIFSLFLGIFTVYIFKEQFGTTYNIIIENIIIVYGFVLFILGLSFFQFFMLKYKIGNLSRTILTVLAIVIPGVQMFFVIIGIAESIFNFRKLPE